MEFVTYIGERIVDILAAFILRAGYRFIDQLFAPEVNGESGDLYVPIGTSIRVGSGGVLSFIGGGGSPRGSVREQPVGEAVIGGASAVLDLPSFE